MPDRQTLTKDERRYLSWYGAETYTISLPADDARRSLEKRGLIDWRGNHLGSNHYAITDAGKAAIKGA